MPSFFLIFILIENHIPKEKQQKIKQRTTIIKQKPFVIKNFVKYYCLLNCNKQFIKIILILNLINNKITKNCAIYWVISEQLITKN